MGTGVTIFLLGRRTPAICGLTVRRIRLLNALHWQSDDRRRIAAKPPTWIKYYIFASEINQTDGKSIPAVSLFSLTTYLCTCRLGHYVCVIDVTRRAMKFMLLSSHEMVAHKRHLNSYKFVIIQIQIRIEKMPYVLFA